MTRNIFIKSRLILAFHFLICYSSNCNKVAVFPSVYKPGFLHNQPKCSRPSTCKTKLKETTEYERENNKTVYFVAYGAVIAAIYTVLTLVFAPISFGPVQFRIAEHCASCLSSHRQRCPACLSAACCPTCSAGQRRSISCLAAWRR